LAPQVKSRFKIGYPKVRGANIKKNLDSKLATLKLGEPISRKLSIQNWLPQSQGSQYQEKSQTKLATLKLGEPISRKISNKIGYPKVRGANIKKNLKQNWLL
jgi:hypothetical protein